MRLDEFLNWETGNYSPELHLVRIHWMGPEPVYDVGASHQAIGGDEKGVRRWESDRGDDCVGVDAVLAVGWFGFFRLWPLGVALGLELVDVAGQVSTEAPRWASGVLRWNPAPAVERSLREDGEPVGA